MDDAGTHRMLRGAVATTARAWRALIAALRDANPVDQLAARLHGLDALQVTGPATQFAAALHHVYLSAAQAEARYLGTEIDRQPAIAKKLVVFDAADDVAISWAGRNRLDLVRELTAEVRQILASALAEGARTGANPRDTAKQFLDSLGLTQYQMERVASYRRALESGDLSRALDAQLGDGRYDRALRAAIESGDAIPPARIEQMVARYRENWIRFRAETIARTQGLRAAHQGSEALYWQAVDNGTIAAEQVERKWLHHPKATERPGHAKMHGQLRSLGESFETPDGVEISYPCDPDAPPEETIRCACAVATRLKPA